MDDIVLDEVEVDPDVAQVYCEGWQSWSPSLVTRWRQNGPRPGDERLHDHFYRRGASWSDPGMHAAGTVQSDGGLLALDPGVGDDVMVYAAPDPAHIPVVRATPHGARTYRITADGPCTRQRFPGPIRRALDAWAAAWPDTWGPRWAPGGECWTARDERPVPPLWCSWYAYRRRVDHAAVQATMDTIRRHQLPVESLLWDDGYFATLGDWRTSVRADLGSLEAMAARVGDRGFAPGLWLCPTLAQVDSEAVRADPEAWVPEVDAPFGTARRVRVLDPTSPAGADLLTGLITGVVEAGFQVLKLDFLWTGALPGRRASGVGPVTAYREALRLIRDAAGPETVLLGCGNPTLASVHAGLTAYRVSPDNGPVWEPPEGDLSQPAGRSAVLTGTARAHLAHLTRPDPDVLMVGPEVQGREEIAAHVDALPRNVRASGDRLDELDDWGVQTTRTVLARGR
ncbi:alpha-galactosidase [Actinomadura violacea]|uniref:Alpha-galactosidase n=1 Tax=Actinomadura violacea TaxID=2819934 RepID=A0ABS3RXM7_9ACTN|nr:alpha-galactosidase [Actinomadura violacea]MBO2461516.1 alpha-galactosidase [Actinomadura violacea]